MGRAAEAAMARSEEAMQRLRQRHEAFVAEFSAELRRALLPEISRLEAEVVRLRETRVVPAPEPCNGSFLEEMSLAASDDAPHANALGRVHFDGVVTSQPGLPAMQQNWLSGFSEATSMSEQPSTAKRLLLLSKSARITQEVLRRQAELDAKRRERERWRLRRLLGMQPEDTTVSYEMLLGALRGRTRASSALDDTVAVAFARLREAALGLPPAFAPQSHRCPEDCAPFETLLAFVLDHSLIRQVVGEEREAEVHSLVALLSQATEEEVIHDATWFANEPVAVASKRQRWDRTLSIVVIFAVLISLACLGLSIDRAPGHPVWTVLEVFCTTVFVVEAIVKLQSLGCRAYFRGEAGGWNTIDFAIIDAAT